MEWIAFWIIMALIVAMVANNRGRSPYPWFFYGLLIWPIALTHILLTERPVPRSEEDGKALPNRPPMTPYGQASIPYRPDPAAPAWPKDLPPREPPKKAPTAPAKAAAPADKAEQALTEAAALRLICATLATRAVLSSDDQIAALAEMTALLRTVKKNVAIDGAQDAEAAKRVVGDTVEGTISIMASLVTTLGTQGSLAVKMHLPPNDPPRPRDTYDLSHEVDIEMTYTDAAGETTRRRVTVESFSGPSEAGAIRMDRFTGHCHLRDGSRTFRLDRVREAAEAETGEIITDLTAWLLERKSRRRPRDLDQ